jgi:hypothetical protein
MRRIALFLAAAAVAFSAATLPALGSNGQGRGHGRDKGATTRERHGRGPKATKDHQKTAEETRTAEQQTTAAPQPPPRSTPRVFLQRQATAPRSERRASLFAPVPGRAVPAAPVARRHSGAGTLNRARPLGRPRIHKPAGAAHVRKPTAGPWSIPRRRELPSASGGSIALPAPVEFDSWGAYAVSGAVVVIALLLGAGLVARRRLLKI